MLIKGDWLLCDDEIVRPVLRAEILARDQTWKAAEFLLDTGADRTVLSANVLAMLGPLPANNDIERISGVGGIIETPVIKTALRLTRENNDKILFRGAYAACTDPDMLDMSVVGRDILDLFTVIIDRSNDFVGLLRDRHSYKLVVES